MARLLIVHHAPTPTVRALADAVVAGAHDDAIEGVEVVVREALEAERRRRARRRRLPARHARQLRLHERGAQALLRHDLPRGRRGARRRRLRREPATAGASRSGCGCTVATTRPGRCGRSSRSCRRSAGGGPPRCSPSSATSARPSGRRPTSSAARSRRSWPAEAGRSRNPAARTPAGTILRCPPPPADPLLVALTLAVLVLAGCRQGPAAPARTATPGRWTPCPRPSSARVAG